MREPDDDRDEHSFDFYEQPESAGTCTETCVHCGHVGCRACMFDTDDGWFCLEECQEEYNRIRKEQ